MSLNRYNATYEKLTKKIGQTFKEYREKSRFSLREIYKDEKISISVISDLETGKKLPRVETLIRLMNKVNMPLYKVFSTDLIPQQLPRLRGILPPDKSMKLHNMLMFEDFLPNEIDEIIKYSEFIKSKRG